MTDQNVADYKDRICSYEPYLEYSVSGSTHEVTNSSKESVAQLISDFPRYIECPQGQEGSAHWKIPRVTGQLWQCRLPVHNKRQRRDKNQPGCQ